jgi:hypothetical protein
MGELEGEDPQQDGGDDQVLKRDKVRGLIGDQGDKNRLNKRTRRPEQCNVM